MGDDDLDHIHGRHSGRPHHYGVPMGTRRSLPSAIDTERLHLRPWKDSDAEPLREMWTERDPRSRHLISPTGHPTVDDFREDFGRQRAETARTGLAVLVIERRGSPGFVGYCGLIVGQASEAEPEIAYELLRAFHNRGYATEAAAAVVAAADSAGWERLWSTIRNWNTPSRRVISKIGFVESGRVDRDPVRGDSIWYVRNRAASGGTAIVPSVSDSPSVTLRARTEADLDVLYRVAADLPTWEERGPSSPAPLTRAAYDARVAREAADGDSEGNVRFVVEADGVAVGSVSLFGSEELARHAEVGIALVPEARGRGIGTAAITQIVEFAFVRRNLRRLHLQAIESNVGAIRAYEKAGFVLEGRQREQAWVRGRYEDIVLMGLLRSEWSARSRSDGSST